MDFLQAILAFIGAVVAFFVMIFLLNAMKIKSGRIIGITSLIVAVIVFALIATAF